MHDFEIDHKRGCDIIDPNGEKVGKLSDVVFDDRTMTPTWAVVQYGLPRRTTLLPIAKVYATDNGLASTVDRSAVHQAPKVKLPAPSTTECEHYYGTNP